MNEKVRLPTYFEKKSSQNKKKYKILIFSGSPRSEKNCSGGNSKTIELAKIGLKSLPEEVDAELIDLALEKDGLIIQPCKGCISTAGGYQCHFPCSCYGKSKSKDDTKDVMYEKDIYKKLQECDGFIIYTPIHWYAPSTQIKAMFDRLVCMSGTLPAEFAMERIGKDPKKTIPAYKKGMYDDKLKNWLEGKYAAFFVHGDDGADDFKRLPIPDSFNKEYDKEANNPLRTIAPIVATCRYSGIFVPDDLIFGIQMNKKINYAAANENFEKDLEEVKEKSKQLALKLYDYIKNK